MKMLLHRVVRKLNKTVGIQRDKKNAFLMIQKQYKQIADEKLSIESLPRDVDLIWVFWWNGFDNMPPVCKACFNSVLKYKKENFKVCFIDKDNYLDYADLPQHIIDKHNNGIISHTHFSDILRVTLLSKWGGLWLDASVFLTDVIPDYVYNSDLFVFKGYNFKNINCEEDGSNISSWFIYSNKNHPLVLSVRDMLFAYWLSNDTLVDYFLFHWFFTIAAIENIKEWNKIPYTPNVLPHYLYFSIFDKPFNKEHYERAVLLSSIHKLSWHRKPIEGSFHDMLVKGIYD